MFIICITIYFALIILSLLIIPSKKNNSKILSNISILTITIMCCLLNYYCTITSIQMGSDRYNYYLSFLGIKGTSIGLQYVFNFTKIFTKNINAVFYFTTFITIYITLYAFNKIKQANKYTLLFLLLTDYVFFSFTGLKQIYTCAIACLIYSIYFNSTIKHKHLINCVLIFIACMFHTTGFILIPIYALFIICERKNINIYKYLFLITILIIGFEKEMLFIAKIFGSILPSLSNKILDYFGESSLHIDDGNSFLSFIKGFPFYLTTLIGITKYKEIKTKEENYDKLLFLSIIGSVLYLCSVFSYWFHRFTILFYLPIGTLFAVVLKHLKGKNKLLFCLAIYGSEAIILIRWLYLIYANYGGF